MTEEFLLELGVAEDLSEKILAEYNKEKLEQGLEAELLKAGVSDKKAACMLLDRDGLCKENLFERVEALKNEHPVLFKTDMPKIVSSAKSLSGTDKDDFVKMSYKERLELYKKSPEAYKKLVQR